MPLVASSTPATIVEGQEALARVKTFSRTLGGWRIVVFSELKPGNIQKFGNLNESCWNRNPNDI